MTVNQPDGAGVEKLLKEKVKGNDGKRVMDGTVCLADFLCRLFYKDVDSEKRDIRTRRKIGRRKEKTLHRVKMLMSVATLGVVAAQLLSICLGWNHMPKTARYIGFSVGLAGDAVFRRRCFA